MASATGSSAAPHPAFQAGLARKALAAFFLSGLLFSFLGVILPVWRHHLNEDFIVVGNHFLSMNLGIGATLAASRFFRFRRVEIQLATACGLVCVVFAYLALLPPGVSPWWRIGGVFFLGCAAGLLNMGIFQALSPLYRQDPAATINLAGALMGAGCITMTALVAGTFYAYSVTTILLFLALLPALFLVMYARTRFVAGPEMCLPTLRQALREFKRPAAVLFALLLFFQFGNEWSLAGWLPLYLVQRLGISPASALVMLTAYWLALLTGRFVVFSVLGSVGRRRMLGASVLAALFGCTILMATDNRFGAIVGILMVGGGFASVYPLVVERMGGRFPHYHPAFFNAVFSFALTGGLLAPWSLGLLSDQFGIGVVMWLPLLGTLMVSLLLVLIWAEARFRERKAAAA
ncbi:MAG: MFS transporter [Bryobacteraceae bacterium]